MTQSDKTVVLRMTVRGARNTKTDEVAISIQDRSTSSQGIDENSGDRRGKALFRRSGIRSMTDSRGVRSYDGSNNNLSNTLWGASYSHLIRCGGASYTDGISSLAGVSRPSPRCHQPLIHKLRLVGSNHIAGLGRFGGKVFCYAKAAPKHLKCL